MPKLRPRVGPHSGFTGPRIDVYTELVDRGAKPGFDAPISDSTTRKMLGDWKPGTGIGTTKASERIAKKVAQGKVAGIRGFVRRNFSNPNVIDLAPVGEFHKAQQAADERSLRKRGVRYKGGKA